MTNEDRGLEGVVVADTALSHVDGDAGRLVIAGADVESLAGRVPFEEAFSRLVFAGSVDADEVRRRLGVARLAAFERLGEVEQALRAADGMDALRAAISSVREATPTDVTAALAVLAAAWSRARAGRAPVAPSPDASLAQDYLRMVRGTTPTDAEARAMDAYFVTVIDHGMNASTFTARVIASTGSDLVSCVTGAIGALKGPLHGGAPGPVLDMLDAIGEPPRAEAWVREELAAGRRIMGMGHRVYRVRDPRAAVLEAQVSLLEGAGAAAGKLALARAVERAAEGVLTERHPERPIRANVEFYTAILLDAIGIPRTLFSPTFAVARSAGWCAHVAEQRSRGRLIRPASRYVGAMP